ncbi:MBL fold metallo-hydrolase [Actinocrispum sp. NPDC049592]|uniref:MBL fold metallo-hydrolase n=1 Tax=Actinocrispum sp. NPDC049592 TaxID=3154835 RepID=UPI00342C7EF0
MHPDRLDRGHPFRQWKTWRIPGTSVTLTGYSRANDKTFFHVPELRCALDADLVEGRQVDTVLLTHTHHDHVKDLDFLAAKAGTDIYLPAAALSDTRAYLDASLRLNHGAAYDPGLVGYRLHGVGQGDEFQLGRHRVRVAECRHKVPCVGYALSEVGKVLLPEHATLKDSLPAKEFGKLMAEKRKAGVPIDQEVRRPLFAFLGDTHPSVFYRNDWLFDYPVIITEGTYLHDTELERAERVGHTVWSKLRPYVEQTRTLCSC